MPTLEDIRREVHSIPEQGMQELCSFLVEQLAARSNLTSTRWTYRQLSKLVGVEASSPSFQACVNILATRPTAKMLEVHFMYFDPDNPDAVGEPVDDSDVALAYRNGYLIEPRSGEAVENFENHLLPYFQLCQQGDG